METSPDVFWTFTFVCNVCGETVRVEDGVEQSHRCRIVIDKRE